MSRRLPVGLLLAVLACGGGGSDSIAPEVVASITLAADTTQLAVRQGLVVKPSYYDAGGRFLVEVTGTVWSSSDPSTVSVDQTGTITANKLGGPVTITATKGGATGTLNVTVFPILKFDPPATAVAIDSTVALSLVATDFFGVTIATPVTTWSSANTPIARVDAAGHVTGVATGFADISATAQGKTLSAHMEVGRASVYDGIWTGPTSAGLPFAQSTATFTVLFGTMRSSSVVIPYVSTAPIVNCTSKFTTATPMGVTSGSFATTLVVLLQPVPTPTAMAVVLSGQFNGNTLNVTLPSLTIPTAAFVAPCTGGTTVSLQNVVTPAMTFAAARQ